MANLGVYWYGRGVEAVQDGTVDWLTGTVKVALLATEYVPDQNNHSLFSDVSSNEVSGSGYTAGGVELTTKTQTYDPATGRVILDADDVSWDPSTIAAQYAVIYEEVTGRLIGYGDASVEQTSDGAAFNIGWHPDGILRTTAVAQA